MRKKSKLIPILLMIVCIALSAVVIIPFLVIFLNSFKGVREAAMFNLALPSELVFSNYLQVFQQTNILRGFMNSFFISGSVVFCINLFASMAAFLIQRRDNKFLKFIYYFFIVGLIMPVAIVPTIKLMHDLNINGTYFSIIMYYTGVMLPFGTFLFVGFMKNIPRELDEAALLEGCSFLKLFYRIIMPLVSPVIITVTIVVMLFVWNDFTGPFYLVTDVSKWTIVLMIFNFITQYSTNWGVVFAFMMLVISPVLLTYFLLQKYIIGGLTVGSVKG
ncbi:carbohydrate ABC transporter permease [Bacillus solitudinis]|uniref:carbohydrate ABC transporter permease n=1 Tax=Bacillus solitudinis TaxID=2014074 RepID=UPI000C23AF87|nr:carbohydrate ABC transporter permease [Bacillus solitudinis]